MESNASRVVSVYKEIFNKEPSALTINRYIGDATRSDLKQAIIDGEKNFQAAIDAKVAHANGLLVQSDCAWGKVLASDKKNCVDQNRV